MKFIEPTIAESDAWRQLTRRRFDSLRSWTRAIARGGKRSTGRFPRASEPQRLHGSVPLPEMLWLPYYRVRFTAPRDGGSVSLEALVDGYELTFTPWDVSTLRWTEQGDRGSFVPTIDADAASVAARQGVLESSLRRAEWTRNVREVETEQVELMQYPYWVYYFERRSDKLDFRMLDGVTGRPGGAKMKLALLKAFRSRDSRHSEKV